ncbi:Putative ASX, DEUBAD domain-containing protein [Septoria linicola]|uniref:ASX, DEUBAD domain-containing protein n=1 Tax=Septoria linicola TaxID=215465 RepID=A0A9Q9AI74_9PEZI|nr:putative ASX, DEUBAD domain-containing protein [Septoria linicola]USW49864.1 Putative ASX, DEUBAD domain-containing protein [Septoria linicola]
MGVAEKRMVTQPESKVGKVPDLPAVLRRDDAWDRLSRETRQELYNCLPPPQDGEAPRNIDVHPLKTSLKSYIEGGVRNWQTDLNDGKEQQKWREAAFRAGQERSSGAWDPVKEQQRKADWGEREVSELGRTLESAVTEKEAQLAQRYQKGYTSKPRKRYALGYEADDEPSTFKTNGTRNRQTLKSKKADPPCVDEKMFSVLQRKDSTTDLSENLEEMHALTVKIGDQPQAITCCRWSPLGLEETASSEHKRWRNDQRVKAVIRRENTAASTTEQ